MRCVRPKASNGTLVVQVCVAKAIYVLCSPKVLHWDSQPPDEFCVRRLNVDIRHRPLGSWFACDPHAKLDRRSPRASSAGQVWIVTGSLMISYLPLDPVAHPGPFQVKAGSDLRGVG